MTDKKIDKNWRIEYKKPIELSDHKSNPRKISKERFELLKDRIKSQGFRVPPSVDNDYILLAGHQRIKALIDMGLGDEPIAISVPEFKLTEKERQEILSSDNLSWGEFDYDILANEFEMEDLIEWGFDKMDFGVIELEPEETKGDDDVPESAPPITVKGDLYELGNHRLLCGDSTMIDDVEKLMDGKKADMVFTDPPYNTGMTAETQSGGNSGTLWKGDGKKKGGKARLSHMFNDAYTDDEWQVFMDGFCSRYDESVKDNSFLFVCLDWRRSHELVPHLKARWKMSNIIIWDKMVHGLGSDYKYTHEFIHVCKKGKPDIASNKDGEKEYQDVWRIQRKMGRDEDHATKKPLEICERPIRHCSKRGWLVLDLFLGSGSTLIACEKTNRKCYGMELDEKYCDVIVKRYVDFCKKNNRNYSVLRNGKQCNDFG